MAQENGWKECHTLGSKAKPFCWKLDEKDSLHIRRQFKSATHASGWITNDRLLTESELKKIHEYVSGNSESGPGPDGQWIDLANNVQKLTEKTEKDGLGKFMFDLYGGKDSNYGQIASHVAALFVESGAWIKNEAQRGMKFKKSSKDNCWLARIDAFYRGSPACDKL